MKKLVLVEDDADLYDLLKYNLEREGFQFAGSLRGRGVLDLCTRERPDLILLDVMLPDADGFELCKLIHANAQLSDTPIIFLTARTTEADRIIGLELGACDYITKPFFIREVITRIRVQLRPRNEVRSILRTGSVELDRSACTVRVDSKDLDLTATEFRLLEYMMTRPGAVFTRRQLLDAVWGYDHAVTERAVDVYILRLRQKLEADPANPRFIRSLRGIGYSVRSDEAPSEALPDR